MARAYCADIPFLTAAEQQAELAKLGDKPIFTEGFGAESFEEVIKGYRGKRGLLAIWGTLRVLGDSRKLIKARVRQLHAAGIIVIDRQSKLRSDKDGLEMLDAALTKIQGSAKVKNDRAFAKKIAAKGGKGKLDSMRSKRMPEEIARPIWQCALPAHERIKLMNPRAGDAYYFEGQWTEATAYRHLGTQH